ncbi:hypothetical protein [Pseudomonas sp. MWU12-3103b]|uniref:hypothetical protein n=1 Tax=Pseudomonas sp. MWU12-3103b TaxID=2928857 RepID=UPI001FFF01D5|nr:hypothetical protein [Pseudomonas sp. MWU12-3103b]
MSTQFKREERYIVVKLKHLAAQQRAPLVNFLLTNGIPKVDCAVVEADWPEYEPVWQMIERRMTGQPAVTAAEELEAVQHWRGKHAQAIRERDALQQLLNERDEQLDSDSAAAALRTLIGMGYSYNGGQLWKPPLGKAPDFNLVGGLRTRIADLESGRSEPVLIQAVAVTRDDDDEGLRLEWLLEGGISELEFAGQVLFAMPEANDLCDENGSAEIYTAPPAPVAVVLNENAEFEAWREAQIASLIRTGYHEAAKAFRDLGSVQWSGWQARACLEATAALNNKPSTEVNP